MKSGWYGTLDMTKNSDEKTDKVQCWLQKWSNELIHTLNLIVKSVLIQHADT